MSRPRILYVLSSLAANDLGDEIVSILSRLSRSEFEPRVVALGGREDLLRRIVELKVKTDSFGLAGPIGAFRAVSKVKGLIARDGADVVHAFGSWGGAVAQLAAPAGTAVVRSVTHPPNHEKDLRGRILRYLERRARPRGASTRFVVPNEGSRGLAERAYGAKDENVTVLPRSIDVADVRDRVRRTSREEARALMGMAPDQSAVALLSDFDSGARMDQVLAGLVLATQQVRGLRVFFVGSGRHEGSTQWKAEELGLADSVSFLGRGTEAGPIWSAADLAIDASPWSSWSRPALIALAAGIPTVKRQEGVGGWSEELGERLPMISGEPDRFAVEIARLAQDAAIRAEVSRVGGGFVQAVDAAKVAGELGKLYRSLAG
ncbi:MAG: glycosyltransferase family 4 protein [Longimicrobiales bacterium]